MNSRKLAMMAGFSAAVLSLFALAWFALAWFAGSAPNRLSSSHRIARLLGAETSHAVSITGEVTYCDPDRGTLFVQTKDRGWRVETAEIDTAIVRGATVQASGVVTEDAGSSLIQSATVLFIKGNSVPPALPITAAQLSDLSLVNRLVSVEGKVITSKAERQGELDIATQVGSKIVEVRVYDWRELNPDRMAGASIRVRGVLESGGHGCAYENCPAVLRSSRSNLNIQYPEAAESGSKPDGDNRLLTRVADIHSLSSAEANKARPVRITGVVTSYNALYAFLFVQDATGGIYVEGANGDIHIAQVGQEVVITGRTGAGQFAPVIVQARIESSRPGRLPNPRRTDLDVVMAGTEDSNWVEMEGIVRSASWEHHLAYLRAESNGVPFRILVTGVKELPLELIDAKVRLQGVCATEFNLRRQITGFYVITPSLDFVHVLESAKDTSAIRARPIQEFGSFSPNIRPGHRERVLGVVTYRSQQVIYIQDGAGSLQVESARPVERIDVGDRVEAVGFSTPKAFGPLLLEGEIRKLGRDPRGISPKKMTAEDIIDRGVEGDLVSIEATLNDRVPSVSGELMMMRAGRVAFPARLENRRGPSVRIGSTLRLTGIPVLQSRRGHPYSAASFTLLLGSPDSVQVLREASWWSARSVIYALCAGGLLSAVIAFWAFLLKRQVRRQTSVIQHQLDEAHNLRAQAESAARVKSDFLANMSHEIRTPLNGIMGMTDLALGETLNSTVRDYLETARSSGASLLQVINDVLDLSKIEAGHMQMEKIALDLDKTIGEAIVLLRPAAAAKTLQIELQYSETAPRWFEGDPSRVRQVILNLLGNAVKFTDRGRITVRVSCQPAQDGMARVRVEVQDTGIGIPADKQASLFQSFTQADTSTTRKYGGTGLGLAICKRLVQLMGGSIGLQSEYGSGSTFWFELSMSLADPPSPVQAPTPTALPVEGKPASILLAEDNLINQKVVIRLLERMGFIVHSVIDGTGAAEAAEEQRFDLILMDCQMPGCDGYEATRKIREHESRNSRPRTPIVALTAHAMPGDRERCLASGMDDYLTKPLKTDELRNTLERWLGAREFSNSK